MKKSIQSKLFLAFLAIGMAILFWQFNNLNVANVSIEKPKQSPSVEFLSMPKTYSTQDASPPKTEKKFIPSELAMKYSTTKDMRAFVEYAKRHPELGGWYYAEQGLAICSLVQNYVIKGQPALNYDSKHSPELYSKRQKAFESLRTSCQGFLPDEMSDDSINKMSKQGIEKQDIFLKIVDDYKKTNDIKNIEQQSKSQLEIKEKILLTKDPLLIAQYGSLINAQSNQAPISYWLDGKSYGESNNEANDIRAAWSLVQCSLGSSCDQTNQEVMYMCLYRNRCADSLPELVQKDLERGGDKDGKQFQKVMQLQKRLIEIVQDGEFSAFKPKQ